MADEEILKQPGVRNTDAEEKEAQKKESNARDQELADVKELLNSKAGVRFFRRLVAASHIFNGSVVTGANGDFMSGRRNLGLMFYADVVEAAPEKLPEILLNRPE